ncbi:YwmB family TATA-box binding protein [Anaeromicropila populeti]|uniref:TATA-box binding n=1 Tax=Anaeromicropila populeti TaxID=37658 RepID=A0A1I6I8A2_9FIRM|nr:YwmB family TATA-box binding protein [Anaeromicropila populeti]SFR62901.1 TATA-box binding [Anaeromicropila populeti]
MKKTRVVLYVVGVLWVAVIAQIIVNRMFINDKRIIDAFMDSNTRVSESKLSISIDYGDKFLSQSDKEDLIAYFADTIQLKKDYEIKTEKGNNTVTMTAKKSGKNATTTIELISVEQKIDGELSKTNHFIIVELSIYEKINSILEYKNSLENAAKQMDVKEYQTLLKFTGAYDGKLSEVEKKQRVNDILERLQAKKVNTVDDGNLYTVYAYTGLVKDYIKVSDCRININIALTYDEEADKTMLYLASPVLNEDY